VVFVVVLVLLLRSFAAEAFVIPTGSMAETLYGYQRIVTCPECGLEFPVNCSSEVDPQEGAPTPVEGCYCPNCRKHLQFPRGPPPPPPPPGVDPPAPAGTPGSRARAPNSLHELSANPPNRLDVVVFKWPGESKPGASRLFPASGPVKNHSAMNYIKR